MAMCYFVIPRGLKMQVADADAIITNAIGRLTFSHLQFTLIRYRALIMCMGKIISALQSDSMQGAG